MRKLLVILLYWRCLFSNYYILEFNFGGREGLCKKFRVPEELLAILGQLNQQCNARTRKCYDAWAQQYLEGVIRITPMLLGRSFGVRNQTEIGCMLARLHLIFILSSRPLCYLFMQSFITFIIRGHCCLFCSLNFEVILYFFLLTVSDLVIRVGFHLPLTYTIVPVCI